MVGMISPSKSDPSMPMLGVIGIPSATAAMMPNCQPPNARLPIPPSVFGVGAFHSPLITRFRPTLKPDSPRFKLKSYHGGAFHSFVKVSAAALPQVSSILLLQVHEHFTCRPWLIRLSSFTCRAL